MAARQCVKRLRRLGKRCGEIGSPLTLSQSLAALVGRGKMQHPPHLASPSSFRFILANRSVLPPWLSANRGPMRFTPPSGRARTEYLGEETWQRTRGEE